MDRSIDCKPESLLWAAPQLADPHAVPDKPRRVREMFARIAGRYDLANRVHSFGMDRRWRQALVRAAAPRPGDRVLDVACGTGDLAAQFSRARAAEVVGLDFAEPMLAVARRKLAGWPIQWVCGDAMALPFPDRSFDIVSIAFGLRNLADTDRAMAELVRVLRAGGRLAVLEFAMPTRPVLGAVGRFFIRRVIPVTGALLTGDRDGAYRYLAASVDHYCTFDQLRQRMSAAGLAAVRTAATMALGSVGLHLGVRP
jgi:demethylmenaquinone methyltransferase/2-methoxy-6-polyprenyl-1,4-benzoquinol methylase